MPTSVADSAFPAPVVVGIDVATAAVRVVCAEADGRITAEGNAPLPQPVRGPRGKSEQDARAWWPAVATALRQATSQLPGRGREALSVAVSATSGTIVLADSAGEPLGPALMYDDRRAAELNAEAQRQGAERWKRVGLSVGPTAALGRVAWFAQLMGGSTSAAAQEGYPRLHDVRADRLHVLHTPDLLGRHLTGGPVATDWSHALKTGYDPRTEEWPTEVFDALGVPAAWLPLVHSPGTEVGVVCPSAAAQTGLPVGCSVRLGMTDGCAGQIATGAVRPGEFVGVLGTTYVLKGVTRELVTDPLGAFYSHRHPDGWWLPGGASNTGGEALADTSPDQLATLDAAASAHGPASHIRYPLRRDGERFPFVSDEARGFTFGAPGGEADRHRAALEGVAFLERLAVDRVRTLGITVEPPLYAAGGGSRSHLWNRIRATTLDMPLQVIGRAETAFGAALVAAVGTFHADLAESAGAMVRPGHVVEPVTAERDALQESYDRFTAELRARSWLAAEHP
ncbi:FGGY-family carbohydrate kinase [Streptomyces sp. NBC_01727]|uniref:FGGY-family carbohydrate kinase n=1 Tax=Streptomyces sp. NBC_01727 TaxID=2975924 RepID=UPI002E122B48|nr:FGGY family carbohydrate kinase [Streptomyces sp. NBC_01727]